MKRDKWAMRWAGVGLLGTMLGGIAAAQSPARPGESAAKRQDVAFAQDTKAQGAQDDLFAGTEKFAKGASDITEVTMDPESLGLVDGPNAKRAHDMVLNVVRSYEYDKPGMYRMEDVEEFRRKLNTGDWHCSIHTRDLKTGESTDICNKRRTDGFVESAIITVEPKELTFIHTIRRGAAGSSLTIPDLGLLMGGVGVELAQVMPGLGPSFGPSLATLAPTMRALRPEMEAEMRGAMAELRAHEGEMEALRLQLPRLDVPKPDPQFRNFQRPSDAPKVDAPPMEERTPGPGQPPDTPNTPTPQP